MLLQLSLAIEMILGGKEGAREREREREKEKVYIIHVIKIAT